MPNSGLLFFELLFQDSVPGHIPHFTYTVDDDMVIGLEIDSLPPADIMSVFHYCLLQSLQLHSIHFSCTLEIPRSNYLLFYLFSSNQVTTKIF